MHLTETAIHFWKSCLGSDSVLQPLWDCMRLNYTDYLRSPLFPVVLTVSSYFVFSFPFLICDIVGDKWAWVQQFKIQPSHRPTASKLLHCAGITLYNHVFFVLPASVAQWAWRPPVDLPDQAPSLLELIIGVCLGGWELVTVGCWTTLNPMILRCHLLTTWVFMVLHVYVSIEDHCGYDFPWSTSRLIPLGIYGGPSKHDVHHQKPNTNFAPHFSHWDKIFGTHADFSFCTAMK
uniref:cholesterol 25-hydroxylase-like protein 1, member 2 isoform X2 n=1 Tax=Monopterus albus TaxID=43700 RepID=UPI0009B31CFD|nr:cholesterol 25-hydroxylase-like protein 1, member 2 isoform X2 [Monopterus albus]